MTASAQSNGFGPTRGDQEFLLSGTGNSDKSFDSGSFGVSGDLGWYLRNQVVAGIRQSVNYASIEGESIRDDFWNGSTGLPRALLTSDGGASHAWLLFQWPEEDCRGCCSEFH